jgi:hypothetical protein
MDMEMWDGFATIGAVVYDDAIASHPETLLLCSCCGG